MWKQLGKDTARMKPSQRRLKQMCFVFKIMPQSKYISHQHHWALQRTEVFVLRDEKAGEERSILSTLHVLSSGCNTVRLLRSKIKRNSQSTCWALCGTSLHNNWGFFLFSCRTESVAEKMLTNWFAFLLHKFLKVKGNLYLTLLLQVTERSTAPLPLTMACIDFFNRLMCIPSK